MQFLGSFMLLQPSIGYARKFVVSINLSCLVREYALKCMHIKALSTLYTGLLLEVVTPGWRQLEPGLGPHSLSFCDFSPPPLSLKGSCLVSDILFYKYLCQIVSLTWLFSEAAFPFALFLILFLKVCAFLRIRTSPSGSTVW